MDCHKGVHLNSGYRQIVQEHVIPYFNKSQLPVAKDLVKYFADESNKREILGNFLKLTVYIKDLSVEEFKDVAMYGPVDLLSDIGKPLFLVPDPSRLICPYACMSLNVHT